MLSGVNTLLHNKWIRTKENRNLSALNVLHSETLNIKSLNYITHSTIGKVVINIVLN